jgi:hypothetical protein
MRVRLDPVGVHNANLIANYSGRSVSNATNVALAEFVRNHISNGRTMQPDEHEAIFGSGKAIAAHASGALAAAVKEYAYREQRSLSSAMRVLLRDALQLHGISVRYRQTAPADAASS